MKKELSPFEQKLNDFVARFQPIPFLQKILFVEYLRVMIKAGISLVEALHTLERQLPNRRMQTMLAQVTAQVEKGQQLSEALGHFPKLFPPIYVQMVASGEVSGRIEETLDQVEMQMKRTQEMNSRIRGAMIYPIIVLVALVGIGVEMLGFVLPKLLVVFTEINVELPLPTKILIVLSNLIVSYGLWIVVALVIFTIVFIFAYRKEPFKFFMHTTYLKIPIIGGIIKKISLARFATTLHSLLSSGISVVEALHITADVIPSRPYKNSLMICAEKIKQGTELSALLNETPDLFPPLVVSMIDVGERTGSIETTLKELSDFYNDGADKTLKNLTTVIEPIVILFLGVVVASMALAVVMPLFTLQQSF